MKSQSHKKKDFEAPDKKAGDLIAKKDFVIHQNDFHREIKKGENLSDIPERYLQNLKVEGIL